MKLIKYIINLIILLIFQIHFSISKAKAWNSNNLFCQLLPNTNDCDGFFIALFQIISQKGEIVSMRSKLKRLQVEIDNLRNESIDEDIELTDSNLED